MREDCLRNPDIDFHPAVAIGMGEALGSIPPGKRAAFTILDVETLAVRHRVIGGELVF